MIVEIIAVQNPSHAEQLQGVTQKIVLGPVTVVGTDLAGAAFRAGAEAATKLPEGIDLGRIQVIAKTVAQ